MFRTITVAAKDVVKQIAATDQYKEGATFIFYDPRFVQDRVQLEMCENTVAGLKRQEDAIDRILGSGTAGGPTGRGKTGTGTGAAGGGGGKTGGGGATSPLTDITGAAVGLASLFTPSYTTDYATPPGDPESLVLGTVANGLQSHIFHPSVMPLFEDVSMSDQADEASVDPITELMSINSKVSGWVEEYDVKGETVAFSAALDTLNTTAAKDSTVPQNVKDEITALQTAIGPLVGVRGTPPSVLPTKGQIDALDAYFEKIKEDVAPLDINEIYMVVYTLKAQLDASYVIADLHSAIVPYMSYLSATTVPGTGEALETQIYRAWLVEQQLEKANTYILNVKVEGVAGGDWATSTPLGGKSRSASAMADLSFMIFDKTGELVDSGSSLAYAKYARDDKTLAGGTIAVREGDDDVSPVGARALPKTSFAPH
jgi:hypothetical protein